MQWHRLGPWIIATVAACAVAGGWLGYHLDDGNAGNIVLIAATGAVLGSFLPNAVVWVRGRLRSHRM